MPRLLPVGPWNTVNGRWRLGAGILILAAAALRLVYLAGNCPLDLAPDEAHYWDWSRNLDWSYYSKGPLVAYLIHMGTRLAGPWVEPFTAGDMLAVRLPAVMCGSLLLVSLYILTVQAFRSDRLACAVVALALTMPLVAAGSSLMTIDAPYTCCWGWALVLGFQACLRRSPWAWPAAGLLVGLGILAKYTMVLWIPSLGLFLLTNPEQRRLLLRPGFWVMVTIALLSCLPILLWNAQHDWVTFRHVSALSRVQQKTVHWLGPLAFAGVQFLLLLGFWFVAWLAAMIALRPWKQADARLRFLWWMSAPMFLVFLLFGFKTGGGEPNWPVTAYISGMVLAAGWLARQLETPSLWYRRLLTGGLVSVCVLGLSLIGLMYFSPSAQPLLARLSGPATQRHPLPLRRFDPTCRLRGWQHLAAEVDRVRDELRQEGIVPVLAASSWSLPGELGFYCKDNPRVYSLGLALGDRFSQYDFWRPNPLWDVDDFRGRTIILIGNGDDRLSEAFELVDASRIVTYEENGQPIARWGITVCRNYRGFQHISHLLAGRKY